MKILDYTVRDKNGIHARPAAVIVTGAKKFSSSVEIKCGERSADAKKLFSVMSLGAQCGDELVFCISGSDEEDAYQMIVKLIEEAEL